MLRRLETRKNSSLKATVNLNHVAHNMNKKERMHCRIIAHNLGILLMNSNWFAICFSSILVMSVQISICIVNKMVLFLSQNIIYN